MQQVLYLPSGKVQHWVQIIHHPIWKRKEQVELKREEVDTAATGHMEKTSIPKALLGARPAARRLHLKCKTAH